jgi:ketosteroid isomerase-like protein
MPPGSQKIEALADAGMTAAMATNLGRENMSAMRALRLCAPVVVLGSVVVLVSVVGFRGACAESTDEQAVMAANTAFYTALSARDAAALAKIYAHEDFVMNVAPSGKSSGPGWLSVEPWTKVIAQVYAQLEVKPSDVHVHVNGNVAWVVDTESVSAKLANGQPQNFTLTTTNIYEKIGGSWLMTQHQPTPVAK